MLDLLMVVPRKRCLFYLPALGDGALLHEQGNCNSSAVSDILVIQ